MYIKTNGAIKNIEKSSKMDIPMYTPTRDYQLHKEEYQQALNEVLDTGMFINGPQINVLEKKLAEYVGVPHAIAVASGTDALLIALMALGVKPDDEIITVAHTWISSSEVISVLNAKPIFIDIDPNTFVMDLDLIEKKITSKTVGILYVSLYGQFGDYKRLEDIGKKHNLWVIEDGAQSFGAWSDGVRSCSWGTIGTTSFFPSKPMGAYGDAGACFTKDDVLATKMKAIRNHGGLVRFKHDYIGINGRMDTLQAAVLNVKMKYFPECLEHRQKIANFYTEQLASVDGIKTPTTYEGMNSAWAQYSLLVTADWINRDEVMDKMKKLGVGINIFYPKGLHEQPCFGVIGKVELPNTNYVCKNVLNIPLYSELTMIEAQYIVDCLKQVLQNPKAN